MTDQQWGELLPALLLVVPLVLAVLDFMTTGSSRRHTGP